MIFEKDGKQYEGTEINSGNMDYIEEKTNAHYRDLLKIKAFYQKWVLWELKAIKIGSPFTLDWDEIKNQGYVMQKYELEG